MLDTRRPLGNEQFVKAIEVKTGIIGKQKPGSKARQ